MLTSRSAANLTFHSHALIFNKWFYGHIVPERLTRGPFPLCVLHYGTWLNSPWHKANSGSDCFTGSSSLPHAAWGRQGGGGGGGWGACITSWKTTAAGGNSCQPVWREGEDAVQPIASAPWETYYRGRPGRELVINLERADIGFWCTGDWQRWPSGARACTHWICVFICIKQKKTGKRFKRKSEERKMREGAEGKRKENDRGAFAPACNKRQSSSTKMAHGDAYLCLLSCPRPPCSSATHILISHLSLPSLSLSHLSISAVISRCLLFPSSSCLPDCVSFKAASFLFFLFFF